MSPIVVGVLGLVALFILMFLRMPIGLAMGLVGFLGIMQLTRAGVALSVLGSTPYSTSIIYIFSVFPLFLLMGQLAFVAEISGDLYKAAYKWFGHLPGGLAIATTGASAGFAAICGDALTGTATMASVALPEMRRYKYSPALASGTIAAGGTLGILIPPSIIFILYGVLTEQSIGELFIAGIIPGVILAGLYGLTIGLICWFRPKYGPPGPKASYRERLSAFKGVWAMLLLFLLVIGGIYAGVFTPTEAAAFGAFGAFIIALAKRQLSRQSLTHALMETLKLVAIVYAILIGAMIFSIFLAMSKIPIELADTLVGLGLTPIIIMVLVIVMFVILGCVIDSLALILLIIPVIYPLIQAIGFDPIWFGVITVIVMQQAMMTPPVGMSCFVMAGAARDIPLSTIFRGVIPFWVATMVCIIILIAFPQLALFLPGLMK